MNFAKTNRKALSKTVAAEQKLPLQTELIYNKKRSLTRRGG